MLELVFEVLIRTIPQATGRGVIYVCTLGQVSCEDGLATIVGIAFLLIVFLVLVIAYFG